MGLARLQGTYQRETALILAASVQVLLPVFVLFLLLEPWLVSGMSAGAVK